MWRIHTYHYKERFLRVAYISLILQIRNNLTRLMQRRPFTRIMPFTVCVPIMRILMLIECSVSVPIVKSMTTVLRCISVPCGYTVFYVFSRTLGVIGSREVSMQFTEIGTVISRITEYIAYTVYILAQ